MTNKCPKCENEYRVRIATYEEPYYYSESGLPNIRLVNIPVYSCPKCSVESADIPNMDGLHRLIAKDIILTPLPMTGRELRFLRKEANLTLAEFSEMIGVDPKTIGNREKADVLTRQTDLVARVTLTGALWKDGEQVEVLTQLLEMVKYDWEPESANEKTAPEVADTIEQLAADNVAFGLNEAQQWEMAA
jgi:transcriptional regulator with XRE-family HTH domain